MICPGDSRCHEVWASEFRNVLSEVHVPIGAEQMAEGSHSAFYVAGRPGTGIQSSCNSYSRRTSFLPGSVLSEEKPRPYILIQGQADSNTNG